MSDILTLSMLFYWQKSQMFNCLNVCTTGRHSYNTQDTKKYFDIFKTITDFIYIIDTKINSFKVWMKLNEYFRKKVKYGFAVKTNIHVSQKRLKTSNCLDRLHNSKQA